MTNKIKFLIIAVICGFGVQSLYAQVNTTKSEKCLAQAIYHEAGGEPLLGQYAIGEVIMNRVYSSKFASTVCGVVQQHYKGHWQFGYHIFNSNRIPVSRRQYFYNVAWRILMREDDFSLPKNVLYFNNIPFKAKRYHFYCKIGHQYFYYLYTVDNKRHIFVD